MRFLIAFLVLLMFSTDTLAGHQGPFARMKDRRAARALAHSSPPQTVYWVGPSVVFYHCHPSTVFPSPVPSPAKELPLPMPMPPRSEVPKEDRP